MDHESNARGARHPLEDLGELLLLGLLFLGSLGRLLVRGGELRLCLGLLLRALSGSLLGALRALDLLRGYRGRRGPSLRVRRGLLRRRVVRRLRVRLRGLDRLLDLLLGRIERLDTLTKRAAADEIIKQAEELRDQAASE